jgi:hypothetical protein
LASTVANPTLALSSGTYHSHCYDRERARSAKAREMTVEAQQAAQAAVEAASAEAEAERVARRAARALSKRAERRLS